MDATVLNGFGRVGDLDQLAGGFSGSAKGRSTANFIRPFPDVQTGCDPSRRRSSGQRHRSNSPAGNDTWCLYRGIWHPVNKENFSAGQWVGFAIVPTDSVGPFLYFQGTFYQAGMSAETTASIAEPFFELARALGRHDARETAKRDRERG
jgi:hypothetical protein